MNKVEAPKPTEYVCHRKGKPRKNGTVRNMSISPTKIGFAASGGGGREESFNEVSSLLVYAGQNSHPERQAVNRQDSQ